MLGPTYPIDPCSTCIQLASQFIPSNNMVGQFSQIIPPAEVMDKQSTLHPLETFIRLNCLIIHYLDTNFTVGSALFGLKSDDM